jgi:integrase
VEIDGRRRWVYGRSRKEVAAKLAEVVEKAKAGVSPAADRITVKEYLERWLEDTVRRRVRPKTYRGYEQLVRLHIVPALGRQRLSKLTPLHVEQLMNATLEAGLSNRTVQYMRAVLRAALAQAVRWRLLSVNVAALTEGPTVRRKAVPALTPADAKVLLAAIAGHRLEALVVVALGLGLRQGEVLGLRWEDVDLEQREVHVRRAVQRMKGQGIQAIELKTEMSRRNLALPDLVADVLAQHRERQQVERVEAGPRWQDTGLVFTTSIGTAMDGSNVTHEFQRVPAKAGLPRMRFYDLRHGCASLLLARGVHPRVVMETLGHSAISLTMNTYSHVSRALQREAALQIDQALRAETVVREPVAGPAAARKRRRVNSK